MSLEYLTQTKLQDYRATIEGLPGYIAGLPSYPRNFSRDVFLAGILMMDADQLQTQFHLSHKYQGSRDDAQTGEEVGKIHHEYPGVSMDGRGDFLTTYNACDTTSLFLIGIEALEQTNKELFQQILANQQSKIIMAVSYILKHLHQNIFYETPPLGVEQYALKVTYWKDSIAPDPLGKEELAYPIAYALAHFQAARGVLSAARILNHRGLELAAEAMYEAGIKDFLKSNEFVLARGRKYKLAQASSDELHCLAYIPAGYQSSIPINEINKRAQLLTTDAGFACTPQDIAKHLSDPYHGYVVWPFEQAFIHYGALKFKMPINTEIAERVIPFIDAGNELLQIDPEIIPAGNSRQLWSVAADMYFKNGSKLKQNMWL